jgi:hypothetical protein
MSELHVYLVEDSERHWYVAKDEEDAFTLYGDPGDPHPDRNRMNQDDEPRESVSITRLDDTQILWVRDDNDVRQERTCREWCAIEGRGFLASTVY